MTFTFANFRNLPLQDSWDADDDEKKDEEKNDRVAPPPKPKKKLHEKIAEKEVSCQLLGWFTPYQCHLVF